MLKIILVKKWNSTVMGELIGVLWVLLFGVTGAHMKGLLWSKLPFDPRGLCVTGINVFVSAGTCHPFFWFSIFFFAGRSFKLYFKWQSSSGLQNDNSSGCLIPLNIPEIIKWHKLRTLEKFKVSFLCYYYYN